MSLKKVLIAVKTYPTLSTKYDELVCTAGFLEDGSMIRIYPVQFRKKAYGQQYKKYDWIELDLVKNRSDFRPESYRPVTHDSEIKIVGEIKPDGASWSERRSIVLGKVYLNLKTLIAEAKDKAVLTSLAVFKPKAVLDLIIKPCKREWSREKLATLQQYSIFEEIKAGKPEVVKKLPYKFSYLLIDENDQKTTMMIEDWELGQLYWNCLRNHEGHDSEVRACADVRKKYLEDFAKTKDLYLFLGTSQKFHYVGKNPFMIIGTFYPKFPSPLRMDPQLNMFN